MIRARRKPTYQGHVGPAAAGLAGGVRGRRPLGAGGFGVPASPGLVAGARRPPARPVGGGNPQQAGGMASPTTGPAGSMRPAPVTQQSATMRANAQQGLSGAQNSYRDQVFRAAMQLGDPGIFAKLQADPQFAGYQFAVDPNSTMSALQRDETTGLQGIDRSAGDANTFFSGLRLNDRTKMSDDFSRQRSAALGNYQDLLSQYAGALTGAQGEFGGAMSDADQYDIDQALGLEPVAGPQPVKTKPKKKAKPKKSKGGRGGG